MKDKVQINEIENSEIIKKINKIETWFFEKILKIDKSPANLIRKKMRKDTNYQHQEWGRWQHYKFYRY